MLTSSELARLRDDSLDEDPLPLIDRELSEILPPAKAVSSHRIHPRLRLGLRSPGYAVSVADAIKVSTNHASTGATPRIELGIFLQNCYSYLNSGRCQRRPVETVPDF